MKVGIAGVGRMGGAMAERLLEQGVEVSVWNRSRSRTGNLVDQGAREASSLGDLLSASDILLTILTDAAAIAAVYDGPDGLLSGRIEGKLFIEMSTVSPETESEIADRIRQKGGDFVECPVGGTVGPARKGMLFGFAGGRRQDVERARPLLELLCRRIEHVGDIGAGSRMKLAINLPLAVYWQALGEALAIARDLDLSGAQIADIFADTSGGPNVLKVRGAALAEALDGSKVPGTFDIDGLRKDLETMLSVARDNGADLPVAQAALACYNESAGAGLGTYDGPQQTAYWRNRTR